MALPHYFLAGFLQAHGSFMWVHQGGKDIPVFQVKCLPEQLPMLEQIVRTLGLREKVHSYTHDTRAYCLLLVRRRGSIQKIIQLLDGRLVGQRKDQFRTWRQRVMQAVRAR